MSSRRFSALVAASLVVLASCGGDSSGDDASNGSTDSAVDAAVDATTGDPMMDAEEPAVSLPATLPTELVITDITEGDGAAAAEGDTVFVFYVGVLTKDGTRFDGNFGQSPFAVTLGSGSVIEGWEQGLVGIKSGGRRQLDIPAELAYGDTGAGDIIKAGDAISFVVDAVAVVPATSADDEPSVTVEATDNLDELVVTDLADGTGTTAEMGMTVVLQLLAFRADTGEQIVSTWKDPQPVTFDLEDGGTLPGLLEALVGMQVGGRRQAHIPFEQAWGAEGQQQIGLPENTDVIVVIDLLAAF
jgi:peptidylprolyl isomerase